MMLGSCKDDLENVGAILMDATCYEVKIKNPTRVKLLWDTICWVHNQMKLWCKALKIPMPRSRFNDQRRKQFNYQKKKKRSHKKNLKRRRSLVYLLEELLGQFLIIRTENGKANLLGDRETVIFNMCQRILKEQKHFLTNPPSSIPDRIVSFAQPHIRPIVRGKENKPVEYGLKVHMVSVSGISYIEHMDFCAFHEGVRYQKTIQKHTEFFGKVNCAGADKLYANNKNRTSSTNKGIVTCFPRKGPKPKDPDKQKDALVKALSNARNTVMEGAFGNHKESYALKKITARNPQIQMLMVYTGVFASNARYLSQNKVA
ncbi:DDE transposase (plasmid) [Persicobacter psychrovividus]|uniref:DDE transposase n=2 Tax=Persicobacter psychrovividus TaxID=387638 RepID=A0ABN6LH00_9BACT|nr:DDE transposase [Persicobacter psychrovividus]